MSAKRVLVITGLSGSGKSCAARALEDVGFFVVDNLPLPLLPQCLGLATTFQPEGGELAVVVDVRNRDYLAEARSTFETLARTGFEIEIFFFEANNDVLTRRFSETRRRHPLASQDQVVHGIELERALLAEMKQLATHFIDSSWLTPHQLRNQVIRLASGDQSSQQLAVLLQSFGFRFGVPVESDLVFDVRFLPNPHYHPDLQPLTGTDQRVRSFSLENPVGRSFLQKLQDMLQFLLPQYRQEGKSYLTVSIGCTGGRHRSVAVVETLRGLLPGEGLHVDVLHRDATKR
ncbi:RNase adapter RapZ [Geothermobacter hydrogeniphilus]|uniref:RNase adaptor protein RapZ n=1 Tax=Geothermobacter hydrogeniphilus TaxID=1969733 RepID=A0A1X0Y398_9BACT|nr:RNase adapter RapZ [Geothermobacter hydrogeniphilus]ORJ59542.1 RNase adaptor protein RapZ [Geothermobacter hydrogeniphilus]